MDIANFDLSEIYKRFDGSYVVNQGLYHIPNEGTWTDLWIQVDAYAKEHPEVVQLESSKPEPTLEEQIEAAYAAFDDSVEKRLDDFAATRRYSSINSACSYSTSTDAQFRLEGEYCVQARDLTYRICYDLLAEYMPTVITGERPIPSWEEIEAQLPELKWPDEEAN